MTDQTDYPTLLDRLLEANNRLLDTLRRQNDTLEQRNHVIVEQRKEIDNLAALVKKPERKLPELITKVRMGRNSSWRQSAWLGLRESVLFAPTRLFEALKQPLAAAVVTVGMTIGAFAIWAFAIPIKFVLGACGFLVEQKELERK